MFVLKMLHSSLNWEKVFSERVLGIWEVHLEIFPVVLEIKLEEVIIECPQVHQSPRLNPKAAKCLLSLALIVEWYNVLSVLTKRSCTRRQFFLDQILILVLKQILQVSEADHGSTLWMFSLTTPALVSSKALDEAIPLQEYLQLYLIRGWGYRTPRVSSALSYQMRNCFEI